MKIDIERIKVDETSRIRQEIGDLASLQQSIQQVGLINPILIDENYTLVAGFRRLSACKNLGWKEVEARIVEMGGDELKMLDAEIAENFYRKEFTPEEVLSTERRRREIEEARRPKGVFERFWKWLKSLFSSDPKPEVKAAPASPAPTAAAQEPEKKQPEKPAAEAEPKTEAQPEPEPKEQPEKPAAEAEPKTEAQPEPETEEQPAPEPEPATETTQTPPPPQPKRAEIVEKDGVRHIKWR